LNHYAAAVNADIQVFYYSGPYTRTLLPTAGALLARLNHVRRQRFERCIDVAQRAQELAALRLLELGAQMSGYASLKLADIEYSSSDRVSGKPAWPAGAVDFSISHAHSIVACAIASQCRVGLDVEERREIDPRIVARLVCDSASLAHGLSRGNAIDRWTQIEAILKGAGLGVMHGREIEWRSDAISLCGKSWWLHPLDFGPTHVAHLAADVPEITVKVQRLDQLENLV
jgi:phosphopantetheinyl transferase